MLVARPRDTINFRTSLTRGVKHCRLLKKNFPGRISPQPLECGARLVTVTNDPVPRPSTASFAVSQAKHFLFSTSWKYQRVPIWLKTLNPKGYAAKYRYRKGLDVYALAKREWAKRK